MKLQYPQALLDLHQTEGEQEKARISCMAVMTEERIIMMTTVARALL